MDLQLPEGGKYLVRVPGGDMEKTLPTATNFYTRLLDNVRVLPGVESAAIIGALPLRCCVESYTFSILGHPAPPPDDRPNAGYSEVSSGIFSTMKIPLLKGRYLDEHDSENAPWVIVVNQAFVRKYFSNEDPIGQQILLRYDPYPCLLYTSINPGNARYNARFDHWLMPVARLKPGVTLAQAQAEMDVIARRLEQDYPSTNKGLGAKVRCV